MPEIRCFFLKSWAKKTAPHRKRANSGGGWSKVGSVGQTMIREKISWLCLFWNSVLIWSCLTLERSHLRKCYFRSIYQLNSDYLALLGFASILMTLQTASSLQAIEFFLSTPWLRFCTRSEKDGCAQSHGLRWMEGKQRLSECIPTTRWCNRSEGCCFASLHWKDCVISLARPGWWATYLKSLSLSL